MTLCVCVCVCARACGEACSLHASPHQTPRTSKITTSPRIKGKETPKQAYVALRDASPHQTPHTSKITTSPHIKGKEPQNRPMWPWEVREVKAPRFLDNRHIKVVRLSAICTGHLYPQEYPGTHFERLSWPRVHELVGCLGKNPQWHDLGSIRGPSD
jgi:hypothetical protein